MSHPHPHPKKIDPGKPTRLQKTQTLVDLIKTTVMSAGDEDVKLFDLAFNAIATGLLENTIPETRHLDDVVTAFEICSTLAHSEITEKRLKPKEAKVFTDVFRATTCLIISAYGQGATDGDSPIAPRLNEICNALEGNLGVFENK